MSSTSDSNNQLVTEPKQNYQLVKYERTAPSMLEDWFDQQLEANKEKQHKVIGNTMRNLCRKPGFKPAFSSMPDLLQSKLRKEVLSNQSEGSGYSHGKGDTSSAKSSVMSRSVSSKAGPTVVASDSPLTFDRMNLQNLIMMGMKDPKLLTAHLLRLPIKQFFRSGIRYRTLINVMLFFCVLFLL